MRLPESRPIALFIGTLHGGGAERVFVTLANAMAALGHRVDLVLVKAEGPYLGQVAKSVRLINLDVSRGMLALPALIRYLRGARPRALISALPVPNIVAAVAGRWVRLRPRIILTEHNTVGVGLKSSLKKRILRVGMAVVYRWADVIVGVSEGVARDLEKVLKLPAHRVRTIYNPVVTPEMIERSREPIAWPFAGPVILAVGRLTRQKDYPTLLRAFARFRGTADGQLVILGEGPLRAELERLAEELGLGTHIIMPGFVDNPYAWMRQADLFVLSSAWEGFGNVLVEAMACGTPVVSTDCPSGPAEILEGGELGALVPPRDHEALALAMSEALSRQHIVGEDRLRRFSARAIVEKYLELVPPASE